MRLTLITFFIGIACYSHSQFTISLCELLHDVDRLRAENHLDSLRLDTKNEDGSYQMLSIPARFAESSFRKLTEEEYSIRYFAYGKPKQISKVAAVLMEEIKYCYPDYVIEEGKHNSDTFIKYFFCAPEEVEGSQIIPEYKKFAFKIIIQYREKEHSQITLTLS